MAQRGNTPTHDLAQKVPAKLKICEEAALACVMTLSFGHGIIKTRSRFHEPRSSKE